STAWLDLQLMPGTRERQIVPPAASAQAKSPSSRAGAHGWRRRAESRALFSGYAPDACTVTCFRAKLRLGETAVKLHWVCVLLLLSIPAFAQRGGMRGGGGGFRGGGGGFHGGGGFRSGSVGRVGGFNRRCVGA